MGGVQREPFVEEAFLDSGGGWRLQKCFEYRRGINHNHRESRSARTASSGLTGGLVGESCANR